jgi:hypothetical protein
VQGSQAHLDIVLAFPACFRNWGLGLQSPLVPARAYPPAPPRPQGALLAPEGWMFPVVGVA